MKTATLRPGLLVSLKTSVRGGVNYRRVDLDPEHETDEGAREARWETTRTIVDPAEFERAAQVRGRCTSLIRGVCSKSEFGLLCPDNREADLEKTVVEARALADQYNASATHTRIEVFTLTGRIAPNDVEAARAIGSEIRELLDGMESGIKAADVEAIRNAANRARSVGAMLSDEVAGKVSAAIVEARNAAREIAKRVEKDGREAATVVAKCKIEAIHAARFAFLDLETAAAEPLPAQPKSLDLPTPTRELEV